VGRSLAKQRRRSGHTIPQRIEALGGRLLTMVRHFPLHGLQLLEVYEALADHTEIALTPPG
jgi:hypothetical protein